MLAACVIRNMKTEIANLKELQIDRDKCRSFRHEQSVSSSCMRYGMVATNFTMMSDTPANHPLGTKCDNFGPSRFCPCTKHTLPATFVHQVGRQGVDSIIDTSANEFVRVGHGSNTIPDIGASLYLETFQNALILLIIARQLWALLEEQGNLDV
jgi:hypothetical protein